MADERQSRDDKANCAKHDLISRNFELNWCERSEQRFELREDMKQGEEIKVYQRRRRRWEKGCEGEEDGDGLYERWATRTTVVIVGITVSR